MQKAILKVFIERKKKPLFEAEIYDDVEKTLDDFQKQLDDNTRFTIKFGQICFRKALFHHYEIYYK